MTKVTQQLADMKFIVKFQTRVLSRANYSSTSINFIKINIFSTLDMKIEINNCNNIDNASINIVEGALNIKYAINGTGKTTIAKAISYKNGMNNELSQLKPLKYLSSDKPEHQPSVNIDLNLSKIVMFDEDYVNNYIFQQEELVKNSFEVFVKTKNYDAQMQEIDTLVSGIRDLVKENSELDGLYHNLDTFLGYFGTSKDKLAGGSILAKALVRGNKIVNIPVGLEDYSELLTSPNKVEWLRWQFKGRPYIGTNDKCPFCTSNIKVHKEKITRLEDEFDAKKIEHLDNTLETFKRLGPYLSDDTNQKLDEVKNNATGLTLIEQQYLIEIRDQVTILYNILYHLKFVNYHSLKDVGKIVKELESYRINIGLLSHLNCENTKSKVELINKALDEIIIKATDLQREVGIQRSLIERTIRDNERSINEFLKYAGYKYTVLLEEDDEGKYKMKLKHIECASVIDTPKTCLSYGERNAFALVLFMHDAMKNDPTKSEPDLIILDDPISSFDGNKKFAIMNMLFLSNNCFKNKTVLLLTHEFNSVIDAIYVLDDKFRPIPNASFLENTLGQMQEKPIVKKDIKSCVEVSLTNIKNSKNNLNKLVYLRRYLEIQGSKGLAWNLLSSLFHKEQNPTVLSPGSREVQMNPADVAIAVAEIQKYVPGFDYALEYNIVKNDAEMVKLFRACTNNYEKVQIFRIINSDKKDKIDNVIMKYINETFHVENDYLYQLNPCEYEIVPDYLIRICNDYIDKWSNP